MNFSESIKYLRSLGNEVTAMSLGLENISELLTALGDPQNNYFKIQIAGTNGKGSTVAFLESICLKAGLKCGATMSPHLVSVTERIRIKGRDIAEEDFASHATVIRKASEDLVARGVLKKVPTYFEQVTAIALRAFAHAGLEIVVLETGLGGGTDAVTAARAAVAAFNSVDLDHQRILGDTIGKIAAKKATIIGPQTRLVVSVAQPDSSAAAEIVKKCQEFSIEPVWAVAESVSADEESADAFSFSTANASYQNVTLALAGKHQFANALLAVAIAEKLPGFGFPVGRDAIAEGLGAARHEGRLEFFNGFLLDGAHNPAGAMALREYLTRFHGRPLTIVFGAMADKNLSEIASVLFPLAERLILTVAANSRAAKTSEIVASIPENFDLSRISETANAAAALEFIERRPVAGELVCVTGSLYLVGEVRKLLGRKERSR